jgi:Mg-chelatase subunit ChlI
MVELLAQINAALYGRRRRPAVDVRRGADTLDARREFWGRTAAPVHAVVGFSIQSTGGDEGAWEDEDEEDEEDKDEDEDEDKEEDEDEDKEEDVRVDAGGGE